LGWSDLFNLQIQSGSGQTVKPKPGNQMKFDLATFKQVKLANSARFLQPQFNAATCSCDNAVLEAHYTVLFTALEKPNSFEIKEILVDVVYGSTDKTDACKSANHY
jgi:hypothetical protein